LLEPATAREFVDEFAEVPIDASEVVWVATANQASSIPEPILNRMNVYEIDAPDEPGSQRIAQAVYRELRAEHSWGRLFPEELGFEAVERLARLKPREMRRVMLSAFGHAKIDGRHEVLASDIKHEGLARRSRIGFS